MGQASVFSHNAGGSHRERRRQALGCPGQGVMLESLPSQMQFRKSSYKWPMLEDGSSLVEKVSGRGCPLSGPLGLTCPK